MAATPVTSVGPATSAAPVTSAVRATAAVWATAVRATSAVWGWAMAVRVTSVAVGGVGYPGYVVGGPGYVEGCDAFGNCFSRRAWGYGSSYGMSTGASCGPFGCTYW